MPVISLVVFVPTGIVISIISGVYKNKFTTRASEQKIFIKAKRSYVEIDLEKKTIIYESNSIPFSEIISFDLYDSSQKIMKSGIPEAIAGGVLFGGSGAIAGAYVGKNEKIKEQTKFILKTYNPRCASLIINLDLDNGLKLFDTLDLLLNNKK